MPELDQAMAGIIFTNRRGTNWSKEVIDYLQNISEKCEIFRKIHEQSSINCDRKFNMFSFFLIFVSFSVSCITVIPFNHVLCDDNYKYSIAILSVFTTTLASIHRFLNYQELSARHLIGSQNFLDLYQNITEQLLAPPEERLDGIVFVKFISARFRAIRKTIPFAPRKIREQFEIAQQRNSTRPDNRRPSTNAVIDIDPTNAENENNDEPEHQINNNNQNYQDYEMRRLNFAT